MNNIHVIYGVGQYGDYKSVADAQKDIGFIVPTARGYHWNEAGEMVQLDGHWYWLEDNPRWNGEYYSDCWRYKDADGLNRDGDETYTITPVYMGEGEPDEDGDYASYETIGYLVD